MPYKFLIFLTLFLSLMLCLVYYVTMRTSAHEAGKLSIVCTTSIIADIAQHIGADCVQVHALMGPGIDPHVYKAREGDVHRLAQADIILYNGLHLEGKMAHILGSMQSYTCTVNLGATLDPEQLIITDSGMPDPHVWHDVILWMSITKTIRDIFIAQDEKNREHYQKNARIYLDQLQQLHEWTQHQIATIAPEKRILITAHDAFSYFGKRYGMQVVGLQGISTDAEISIDDIQQLVSLLIEKNIDTIFIESSIPHRSLQAVQQAARARNWAVRLGDELYSDALGSPQGSAGTYYDMIRQNVAAIRNGLTH